jgi:hypothetical protein
MRVLGQIDLTATNPAAPATGATRLHRRDIGGRQMPAFIAPSGFGGALQPLLARNKVGLWLPSGNSANMPGVTGFLAYSTTGTTTARSVTTGSVLGRLRRLGFVSATSAGAVCGTRVAAAQVTTGTTIGGIAVGGFFKVIRFGISDAATVTGAQMFVGMSSVVAGLSAVEPSTLGDSIGVGHGASDTNLKLYYGGSAAQTPIDLGSNFPNAIDTAFELALFCAPGSVDISWAVTNLTNGAVASGTIAGVSGTNVPAPATLLSFSRNWRGNNATALAVGLDICSDYIETDM